MRYIDTHAHLYDEVYDEDRAEMIARAVAAGVDRIFLADCDSGCRAKMKAIAEAFPEVCKMMVGVHPTSINDCPTWRDEVAMVREELVNNRSRYIAVGEIGIDLYWSRDFEREQREAFESQLELSLEFGLPVAVHVRDAWSETIEILEGFKGRGLRGVIHAFSGDVEAYRRIKVCGDFIFAVGGVVTFKNSKLGDVVREISLDDLVLETDAPYLTPTPHRGKRNESAYIPLIGECVARVHGVSAEVVAEKTTANVERIFGTK
ncbi:MAG: TatD family hydrolase [Rikenellaceae bacterium]